MKVERQSDHEISEAGAKAATGNTLARWFELIDEKGGLALGRRGIGDWMVGELKVDPWWVTTITHEYEIARGQLEKDGKPKGYTICATKSIKAEADACYAAFSGDWFGPYTLKKANPGKNMRMTWADPGLTMPAPMEIKFQGTPGKCTVMVTIERLQTRAEADGYRKAWGEELNRLKAQLEG